MEITLHRAGAVGGPTVSENGYFYICTLLRVDSVLASDQASQLTPQCKGRTGRRSSRRTGRTGYWADNTLIRATLGPTVTKIKKKHIFRHSAIKKCRFFFTYLTLDLVLIQL